MSSGEFVWIKATSFQELLYVRPLFQARKSRATGRMIGPLNLSEDGNREENSSKLCGSSVGISMLREQIASPTLNHTFYLFLFRETSAATTIRKTVTKSLFFSSPTQGTPNNGTSNTYFQK